MEAFSFIDIAHLLTIFEADTSKLEQGAEKASDELEKVGDKAEDAARKTEGAFGKISRSASVLGASLKSSGSSMMSFGGQLTQYVSAPLQAMGQLGISFNTTKEQALTSFNVMLGSADKAKQLFGDLQKFAADTPFEMPGINNAAKSLLAFGVSQEKIIPTLTQIGDVASGLNIPLGELTEIYGKARVQGRLFGEDINQLTGRGIPITKELAKQFGVTEDKIKEMVEKGKIGFPELEKAFQSLTGKGGQFAGMMEAQSKTFSGRLATLTDNVNNLLGDATEPIFNMISAAMPEIIKLVEMLGNQFKALSPFGQTVVAVIGAIGAAIGPVVTVLGGLIVGIGSVVSALGTITAAGGLSAIIGSFLTAAAPVVAVLAAIAAAVGAVYLAWQTNFGNIQGLVASVADGVKTAWSDVVAYFTSGDGAQFIPFIKASWESLKAELTPIIEAVSTAVSEAFGETVNWVRQNYPLIKDTVLAIIGAIKAYVGTELAIINAFWSAHGDEIKQVAGSAWEFIKTYIGGAMRGIGDVVKVIMQVITGDWRGAWETIKDLVRHGSETVHSLFLQLQSTSIRITEYIGQAIIQLVKDHWRQVVDFIFDSVLKIGETILNIPVYVVKAIPAMLKAGFELANAFYEGAKSAFLLQEMPSFGAGMGEKIAVDAPAAMMTREVYKAPAELAKTTNLANKASSAIRSIGGEAGKSKEKVKELVNISFDKLLDAMRIGTAGQETGGTKDPQKARNRRTGATGTWQVLPKNIPEWTYKTLGVAMTVEQFKNDANAQLLVFNKYMGEYLQRGLKIAGSDWRKAVRIAAVQWYGVSKKEGLGYDDPTIFKKGEPSRREYTSKVLRRTLAALHGDIKQPEFDLASTPAYKSADTYNNKLESLTNAFRNLTATTELAKLNIELLGKDFQNLEPKQKENLRNVAKQIDAHNNLQTALDKVKNTVESLQSGLVKKTLLDEITAQLADPNLTEAFNKYAETMKMSREELDKYLRSIAFFKDSQEYWANMKDIKPPKLNLASVKRDTEIPVIVHPVKEVSEEWKAFAADISKLFGDAFNKLREGGFKAMIKGMLLDFANMVNQMAIKWATSEIFKALTNEYPGGESQNKSGGWLAKILGMGISALGAAFGAKAVTKVSPDPAVAALTRPRIVPGRANGGAVTAGSPYWVGEKEMELFVPRSSGTIFNQKQLAQMRGGVSGGGDNVSVVNNYHFHANERTGAFSKPSAEQTINALSQNHRHAAKKSNKF